MSQSHVGGVPGDYFGRMGPFQRLAASGSTLLDGLVSWWDLDETSGTRVDAVGSNDLTDNNTVGYTASGKIGNAASFVAANSEYLQSTAVQPPNTEQFTVSGWFNHAEVVNQGVIGIGADATAGVLTLRDRTGSPKVWASSSVINALTGVPHGTWYMVTFQRIIDGGDYYVKAKVNDGSWQTGSVITGTPIEELTHGLRIGYQGVGYYEGTADLIGYWDRILTDDEVDELYNLGASIKNEFTDNGEGFRQNLLAYYKLEEASGVRVNTVNPGTYNLTDYNTTGSEAGKSNVAASLIRGNSEYLGTTANPAWWGNSASVDAFTFVCWAKHTATPVVGWHEFFSYSGRLHFANYTSGSGDTISYGCYAQIFTGTWESSGTGWTNPILNSNNWRFYGISFSNTEGRWRSFYSNDSDVLTFIANKVPGGALELGATGNDFFIGATTTPSNYFDGAIDEAMMFSRALSDDEITALFNLNAGRFHDFNTVE